MDNEQTRWQVQQANPDSAAEYYSLDLMDTDDFNSQVSTHGLSNGLLSTTQLNIEDSSPSPHFNPPSMECNPSLNDPPLSEHAANDPSYPSLQPIGQNNFHNANNYGSLFRTTADATNLNLNSADDPLNLTNIAFTPQEEALFTANFQQTNAEPFFADSQPMSDAGFDHLLRSLPTTHDTDITSAPASAPSPVAEPEMPTPTPVSTPSTREVDRSICKYLHAIDAKASSIKEHAKAIELLVKARAAHLDQGSEGSKQRGIICCVLRRHGQV